MEPKSPLKWNLLLDFGMDPSLNFRLLKFGSEGTCRTQGVPLSMIIQHKKLITYESMADSFQMTSTKLMASHDL